MHMCINMFVAYLFLSACVTCLLPDQTRDAEKTVEEAKKRSKKKRP